MCFDECCGHLNGLLEARGVRLGALAVVEWITQAIHPPGAPLQIERYTVTLDLDAVIHIGVRSDRLSNSGSSGRKCDRSEQLGRVAGLDPDDDALSAKQSVIAYSSTSESEPVLQHGMFLALASAVEQVLSSRSVGGARETRWRPTGAMASFTVLRQPHSGWLSSRWLRGAGMLMLFQGGAFLLLAARIVHCNSERSANVSTTLA